MPISNPESLKILIVSAEDSSAMYATSLLKHWKAQNINIDAFGVGSKSMAEQGFRVVARSEDLAVMGLQEIISHWSVIKTSFHNLVSEAQKEKPDLILLMDYPEFNLRLAKKLKKLGFPILYYISPQIWAWRTYRVHKIKKLVDHMFVIFPFEVEFYEKHQVPVTFVGHPLIDFLDTLLPDPSEIEKMRKEILPSGKNHILGLMPGSRGHEIKYNLETQIEAANKVVELNPNVRPVLFVAPSLDLEEMKQKAQSLGFQGATVKKDPFHMISLADTVLCASGTATLMVGLCEKPMVIMYKMNSISAFFAKMLVRHVPFFGMVNLISKKEVVPERFQDKANEKELSSLLTVLIKNTDGVREQCLANLAQLKKELGSSGGIANLANKIEEYYKAIKC